MSDERPVEKIGPSGLSAAQIHKLIQETGLKPRPIFTDREVVRRVIDSLVEQGKLRVVEEVDLDDSIRGFLMCPSCKRDMRSDEWSGWEFCPCGNKIKR